MKITDDEIKRVCSAVIYKRGLEYFKDGRVHIKSREESAVNALVDGEGIYNVRINFDGDKITDCFCTCPYFQTMETNCKHIAATLKKRQCELLEGEGYKDENDRIARTLCNEFAQNCFIKKRLKIRFILNITTTEERKCRYSVSLMCGFDELKPVSGIDKFLDCYINKEDFKLSKHTVINCLNYSIGENEEKILKILCEAYQNKASDIGYVNRIAQSYIAPATAKRIFELLPLVESECYLNMLPVADYPFYEDNPDIVIDINATDSEINLNIFDSGIALFNDGSWFIFEGGFYHTDEEWRSWFMPIYNSLTEESRTQIDFKGNTRVDFATYVYPKLRNKRGIAITGLDELVINEEPEFLLYLDYVNNNVTADINVKYGNFTLKLPIDAPHSEKIVIRNLDAEKEILSYFLDFDEINGRFYVSQDENVFDFITDKIKILEEKAKIYASDSFNRLISKRDISVNAKVSYKKDIDLLEIGFKSELLGEEIYDILNAVKLKHKYYRFDDGSFLSLDDKAIKGFSLLKSLNVSEKELISGRKLVSKYHIMYFDALKEEGRIKADDAFEELIKNIKKIKANIPKGIKTVLRKYQTDGVNWLKQLSEFGFGGILADDMGLGKTLEVIAFVMSERRDNPVLVVSPSALIYNWLDEIKKFAPSAKALIIDGTKEERELHLKNINGYDFIITSYPLIRRDIDLYTQFEFDYMFIDESQHIKNPDTMSAKAVKKVNAKRKFALSGTPVENNLTELWSVFDYCMHGYLGTRKEFAALYDKLNADEDEQQLYELHKKIKPFVMRRMKAEVLSELPEKIENTIFSDFLPEQKKMYEAFLAVAKKEVLSLFNERSGNMQILTLLLRMRQICCHPALFDDNYKKDSAKLILLEDIVNSAISQGHRILIFSQFTSMLEIIRKRLKKCGFDCFFIDGKTPPQMRTAYAERFNSGEKNLFLISLKAGGTGLNLTGADTVIHYDPWWNTAVTDQASDRAYRIGQTKAVRVIRLAVKGTIEEQILKLQESKRNLAQSVIRENKKTISGLTKEEILSLFEGGE